MSRPHPLLRLGLWPLAEIYAGVQRLRVWLYKRGFLKSHRLPGLVISIGNIEVGGTGKSPLVVAVSRYLLSQGASPAILTRGYRSGLAADESIVLRGSEVLLPAAQTSEPRCDEARMQAVQLAGVPVIVGARRFEAAQRYLTHYPPPTHWILDDGFQHLRLRRDLDLVLLDAHKPFDNGHCLPLGRLRESPSALRRAHAVIFTRATTALPEASYLSLLSGWRLPYFRASFVDGAPRLMAGPETKDRPVEKWILALGLARPERLIKSLEAQGLSIIRQHIVGDHEAFDSALLQSWKDEADALLTSEKDYWRAPRALASLGLPVYVIPLGIHWREPESLQKIFNLLTPR